jgi:hypothetical protein
MPEQKFNPPFDGQIVHEFVGNEIAIVAGRFSLAHRVSYDVVEALPDNVQDRTLITPKSACTEEVETLLKDTDIYLLTKDKDHGTYVSYHVPLQAKPLANERLFPDRESTETYISDTELYAALGNLWARVHRLTGRVPEEAPASFTGLLEFTSSQSTLFPIPPYEWKKILPVGEARRHFISTAEAELKLLNPEEDHTPLLRAAEDAWRAAR